MSKRVTTLSYSRQSGSIARDARQLLISLSARLLFHVVMVVGCIVVLLPFLWMIASSLKTADAVIAFPPQWIPNPVVWDNYPQSWAVLPMAAAYLNSIKISSLDTVGGLLTCSMAAYAFARLRFPGRNALFIILLATLMIPQEVNLIPLYILFKQIHWIDTHWPLIVPPILQNPYGVFLLRQFFRSLPSELEDAARIDGANPWTIYTRIALPLAVPALVTLGIFIFLFKRVGFNITRGAVWAHGP